MSLQSSQHAGTKNKAGSQLSVVVSMMGWVESSTSHQRVISWLLQPRAHAGRKDGRKKLLRAFSDIRSAALPLWQACHLFSYRTFSS